MSTPRGLSPEEAALWEQLAKTVKPLHAAPAPKNSPRQGGGVGGGGSSKRAGGPPPPSLPLKGQGLAEKIGNRKPAQPDITLPAPRPKENHTGLDSHWERRLARESTSPDFTLDLHGHTLDSAWHRLDAGLVQAKAMGARLVLVVTGRPRPVAAADRAERRGAIRAKLLDWLAAGPHAADIAAIRPAQRRHGGEGALYLVLKRQPKGRF